MSKSWESYLKPVCLVIVVLLLGQWLTSRRNYPEGRAYLPTKPSGALISMPQAASVHGFQVKPLTRSPGPLPLNLEENSRFTFVIELAGYEKEVLRLTKEEILQSPTVVLRPTIPVLIPALYLVRDLPFLTLALFLSLLFGALVVWPQQRARKREEALWSSGEILPGMHLNEYTLQSRLGGGGGGQVYRAHKEGRDIAIKILREGSSETFEEMEREFKATRDLSHRGIVHLLDWGQARGLNYLVFEFAPGETLPRNAAPAEVCDWALQLVSALSYAHQQGVVHRDIKPANIIRTPEGTLRILDFGIAGRMDEGPAEGSGTAGFMAPEQVNGEVSPACDYYSLGVTLYHALTGNMPFEGETTVQILAAQTQESFKPLKAQRPDAPDDLCNLIEGWMSLQPERRPQDAQAIQNQLRELNFSLSSEAD